MLSEEILRVHRNLKLLREFMDSLYSHLEDRRTTHITENIEELLPYVYGMIKSAAMKKAPVAAMPEKLEEVMSQLFQMKGLDVKYTEEANSNGTKTLYVNVTGENVEEYREALDSLNNTSDQIKLLLSSSLLQLTGVTELFFSEMFHSYFSKQPNNLIPTEKIFTYSELESFSTIDEARKYYLSGRIEEILRKSFVDWAKAAKDKMSLSMGYLDSDMPLLVETFQRRNLIVHNGGRANSIYLSLVSKASKDLVKDISIGDDITPNLDYLKQRTDLLEKSCVLIGFELWKKQDPFDVERAHVIDIITYQSLLAKRWNVAMAISEFAVRDAKLPETAITIAQLNLWLCKKRIGNYQELQVELGKVDYSGRSIVFQLGLAALKNDADEFFRLLPRAFRAEELPKKSAYEFPIFEEMREDPRFHKCCEEESRVLAPMLTAPAPTSDDAINPSADQG